MRSMRPNGPNRPFRSPSIQGAETQPVVTSVTPDNGRIGGGLAVTITGRNFRNTGSGAPTVRFGVFAATSVVVVSSTTITCNTPAVTSSGRYDVSVTIDGQTGTLFGGFIYFETIIQSISPAYSAATGGVQVTIKGLNFVSGASFTFGGVAATNVLFVDSQTYLATVPAHAPGFVSVVMTDAHGTTTFSHGFQYTLLTRGEDVRRIPAISIRDVLNNVANTCSFRVDGGSNVPVVGEQIEIVDTVIGFGHKRLVNDFGAIGAWRLDETSGVAAADYSGFGHPLTYVGGYTQGQSGALADGNKAVSLDGASGHLTGGDVTQFEFTTAFSVEFFVKFTSTSLMVVVSKSDSSNRGWLVYANSGGIAFASATAAGASLWNFSTGAGTVNDGEWHHIVCTWDGTTGANGVKIYKDGVVAAQATAAAGTPGTNAKFFAIGTYDTLTTLFFNGTIDEVALYQDDLSATDVADLYEARERSILFRGNVQSVETVYEEQTDQLAYNVTAVDFTWLLNKYRPFGVYKNQSVTDIVKDLIAKYASGFTSEFVQTKLTRVTAIFDGSLDFVSCMNALAESIGGGHWYADYNQAFHFFHRLPEGIIIPSQSGPGTAMTVAEGAGIPSTFRFDTGFYSLLSSFVYDNGIETALSPLSNYAAMEGDRIFDVSNVPTGAGIGSHVCVARRIYFQYIGEKGISFGKFCQINDNATTSFTTYFGATGASVTSIVAVADIVAMPALPAIASPASPTTPPGVSQGTQLTFIPQYPQLEANQRTVTYTPGRWAFKYAYVMPDGSESFPSPASNVVSLDGVHAVNVGNVAVGPSGALARKIYASFGSAESIPYSVLRSRMQASLQAGTFFNDWAGSIGVTDAQLLEARGSIPATYEEMISLVGQGDIDGLLTNQKDPDFSPGTTAMWYFFNDNTTTTGTIGPGTGGGFPAVNADDPNNPIPTWPNADGPDLEAFDLPDDIDDTNVAFLRDPAFGFTIDTSQVRNRVYIKGPGVLLARAALTGVSELEVSDVTNFWTSGGLLLAGVHKLAYRGKSAPSGPGKLLLTAPLAVDLEQGDSVRLFYQADDVAAQRELGRIEFDKNGLPTDGIHEGYIIDETLVTPLQFYIRSQAELELFGRPIITVRYGTTDRKTRSGAKVHIDLSSPPLKGDFLIQDVTIDQVHENEHDEPPRFSVTASSVKFELNDLLLMISTAKLDTRTGGPGVVVQEVPPPVQTDYDTLINVGRRSGWTIAMAGTTAFTLVGISTQQSTGGPTAANDDENDGTAQIRLTATTGGTGQLFSAATRFGWEPTLVMQLRTGDSVADPLILWMGLTDLLTVPSQNDPYPSSRLLCAVRYSTFSSGSYQGLALSADQGWVGVVQNSTTNPYGTGQARTTSKIADIAANTVYTAVIKISGRSQVTFQINNGPVASIPFVPSENSTLNAFFGMSVNGQSRFMRMRRVYFQTN